jgi:cytochrome P450
VRKKPKEEERTRRVYVCVGVCDWSSCVVGWLLQAGYRLCLGKESAFLQMRITAALLCRFFRFHLQRPGHTVTYRMMAILAIDNGLPITVELRPPQQQQQ